MNNLTISDQASTYTRVSKTKARKLFDQGERIAACPVKLRPGYPWAPHMELRGVEDRTFDELVISFENYNCQLNETGYYAAFYVIRENKPVAEI